MAKVIAFSNQKGGVGKTTTTAAVACGLVKKGFKVLCVDLDPQANLSFSAKAQTEDCATIYDVLKGEIKTLFAIQRKECFDVISSNILLSSIELEFTQDGREFLLKEALSSVHNRYDYIIIDTPPALSILTVNAFTAADYVVIPMLADIFSLQGIAQLTETISKVRAYCNPNLQISGIVLTKFNNRTVLSKEVLGTAKIIADELKTMVYKTTIRNSVVIMEAQTNQQSIFDYAPRNEAVKDYDKLVNEMISNGI